MEQTVKQIKGHGERRLGVLTSMIEQEHEQILLNAQRKAKKRQFDEEERIRDIFKVKQQKVKKALEREHEESMAEIQKKFKAQLGQCRAKFKAKEEQDVQTTKAVAEESKKNSLRLVEAKRLMEEQLAEKRATIAEQFQKKREVERFALINHYEQRVVEAENSLAELHFKKDSQMQMIKQDMQKESDRELLKRTHDQCEITKQRLQQLRAKLHQRVTQDKLKTEMNYKKDHLTQETLFV